MSEYAIQIKGLEKHFKQFSLGPMDLSVPKGAVVGYIGQNGAGKSTTMKLMLGLLKPDKGSIRVLGEEDTQNAAIKDRIGVVFDNLFLPDELNAREAARFCGSVYTRWDEAQFQEYLHRFQLPERQNIKSYSRGMKMKLSMAIALSHHAELLLLDEATSGLDPIAREEILDALLAFMLPEEHSVLISSHILSDLEKIADYIAFIDKGKLLFQETKDALREDYGLCAVNDAQLKEIDKAAIVGMRSHAFGKELLVKRCLMPPQLPLERPSIEDIMIYFLKGDTL